MNKDASYRDSHAMPGKGEQYDSYYENDPWQAFMWEREQECIDELLQAHFAGREIELLDFACGSGRITSFLETRVASCVGVDVSEPMLERARAKLKKTEIITADLTRENSLEGRKFDLITAFRFFTNAEDELREAVMQVLPNYLADDGLLLFNNHHLPTSMYYQSQEWIKQLRGRSTESAVRMMSMDETLSLIDRAGLKPVAMRNVGFLHLPRLALPAGLTLSAERLARRFDWMSKRCESVMILCSR